MYFRPLGSTGILISELGFGTWGIGHGMWGKTDDQESIHALQTAINAGVNFIDTALIYGDDLNHHSEKLIGQCLKSLPKERKVYVATKIYPLNSQWPALPHIPIEEVFPKEWIYEAVETSLRNLGVQSIDLMQFHVWQDNFAGDAEWQDTIKEITKEGKVKFWGLSLNDYQPENCRRTIETGLISSVQLIFNIFHQMPTSMFPFYKEHNVGVIARVPLDEGGLTGNIKEDTVFPPGDFRVCYFTADRKKELVKRVEELEALLGTEAHDLSELALRYILSFDEVSTVIPGMRSEKHAIINSHISDGRRLSPQLLEELKKYTWERNFYS
ncbi:TPA: aldo/keto reductase [Candidatus Woesearchaeota archaeon]|nr:aldo/keto reductase [Candidatus Woesearchaeota archaeon]